MAKLIKVNRNHSYNVETTGRCWQCNKRFIWLKKLGKLRDITCPICHSKLKATTHQFDGDTYYIESK